MNEREEGNVGTSAVVVREMEKGEAVLSLSRRARGKGGAEGEGEH